MLDRLLHLMGFGLCHQLPERSFSGGGLQAPVCARDTGIYVGFVVCLALVAWLHRGERPRDFPRWWAAVAIAALIAFMGWDGVTSYAGLRSTTNELRLLSGLGVGFACGLIAIPILNDVLWKRSSPSRVLDPGWRFGVWLVAIPASYAALWWGGPVLGQAYPVLIGVCVLATLSAVNLIIVAMLPMFDRRAERIAHLVMPLAIAFMLAVGEIVLAGWFRAAVSGAAARVS